MNNQEFQTVCAILREIADSFSEELQDAQTLPELNFENADSFEFEATENN